MRTELPHVLHDHALTYEQGGIDLTSRSLRNSRGFSLSAAAFVANGHAFWWTRRGFSRHRRFVRSAITPAVFHRNERFGAKSGNRGRAGISLLKQGCLSGSDES